MGTVYEATQLSLNRSVALKVIATGVPIDETLRARFRREGPLQAVIDHPHILPVYEAGESKGRLFIAMRLVRGQTLKALAASRALEPAASLRILGDIADALDATHAAGLVHRDVKPQNILVAPGDYAYLADFGLSKGRSNDTVTREGQLIGSISYISPEQVRGESATTASDIYSFTCVVYECLVGIVPFPRETDHAVLHAHVWEPRPRPSEVRPELPPALDDVIARGMAQHAEDRPAYARGLVRDVQSALGVAPQPPAEEESPTLPLGPVLDDVPSTRPGVRAAAPERPRKLPRVGRLAAVFGAVAVLMGGLAGYLAARTSDRKSDATGRTATNQRDAGNSAEVRYARDLRQALTSLNAGKAPLEDKLKNARTAHGESVALAALATEYRKAQRAVAGARPPSRHRSANQAVTVALGRVGSDYARLESAVGRRSRRAYGTAAAALRTGQKELAQAGERLKRQVSRVE
jgi:serine/threonine protein kinase